MITGSAILSIWGLLHVLFVVRASAHGRVVSAVCKLLTGVSIVLFAANVVYRMGRKSKLRNLCQTLHHTVVARSEQRRVLGRTTAE